MATLTFSINIPGTGRLEYSHNLSTESATKLMKAYKEIYGMVDGQSGKRDRTDQEVVNAIAIGLFNGMISVANKHEESMAFKNLKSTMAAIALD